MSGFKMLKKSVILEKRGLCGTAGDHLANLAVQAVKPYMPYLTGAMSDSVRTKGGKISVNVPYAHRRYFEAKEVGLRGPKYFERMKADKRDYLLRCAAKCTGGRVKNDR